MDQIWETCSCDDCGQQRERKGFPRSITEYEKQKAAGILKALDIPSHCPRCGSTAVTKTNKYTSAQFTGCSNWPKCSWSRDGVSNMPVKTPLLETGKTVKFWTNNGPIVGTVIGKNDTSNFILRVDKRSPVQGFSIGSGEEHLIKEYAGLEYKKNIKSYTYWHISQEQEVEEATEKDLLPDPKEEERRLKELDEIERQRDINRQIDREVERRIEKVQQELKAQQAAEAQAQAESTTETASKEIKMSDKKSAMQLAKSDAHQAAFRTAGKKISQGANVALTKMFQGMLGPEHGAAVEAIMSTPAGTMLTQLAMGWGLTYAPGPAQDSRIQKLAEEFRVQGTATGMEIVVDGLMQHLTPVLNEALKMLPGAENTTNTRIATETSAPAIAADAEEHGLDDLAAEPKRAAAGK